MNSQSKFMCYTCPLRARKVPFGSEDIFDSEVLPWDEMANGSTQTEAHIFIHGRCFAKKFRAPKIDCTIPS